MITRTVALTVSKEVLEHMSAKEADLYVKRKALYKFFEELVEHIEPKMIDEGNHSYYLDNLVSFHFELVGGSLPDHESDS